jgi:hypothetical protein
MRQNITHVHNGIEYEGFRPYRGPDDVIRPTGRTKYGTITAILTSNSPQEVDGPYPQNSHHTVWTVIDTKSTMYMFEEFIKHYYPQVNYTRYLRSRT